MNPVWLNLRSGIYSLLLHTAVLGLLTVSIEFAPAPAIRPVPEVDIVQAVTVDNKEIEAELQRLKEIEREKQNKQNREQRELEQKLKALEKEAQQAEKKRKTEEKKLLEAKKQKQEEEKKLLEAKKQKQEQEKKRKEEEQKLAAAEKQRQELEKKRKEEEEKKRKAEEQQQQKERQEALQKQLAEEQQQQDEQLLQNITANIYRRLVSNFNKSGLPNGLECVLLVRLIPGGEVVNVSVSKSSGNEIFDRRALLAVEKASPLPIPEDSATFERLKLRQFSFIFRPAD